MTLQLQSEGFTITWHWPTVLVITSVTYIVQVVSSFHACRLCFCLFLMYQCLKLGRIWGFDFKIYFPYFPFKTRIIMRSSWVKDPNVLVVSKSNVGVWIAVNGYWLIQREWMDFWYVYMNSASVGWWCRMIGKATFFFTRKSSRVNDTTRVILLFWYCCFITCPK